MCLISYTGDIHVASEDMTVYKIIWRSNESSVRNFCYSPGVRYDLGAPLHPIQFTGEIETRFEKGFHAYRSWFPDWPQQMAVLVSEKIVAFTIPKGAHYALGDDNDIVSDSIIAGDLTELFNPFTSGAI